MICLSLRIVVGTEATLQERQMDGNAFVGSRADKPLPTIYLPSPAPGDTHVHVMLSLCIKLALAAGFGVIILALL